MIDAADDPFDADPGPAAPLSRVMITGLKLELDNALAGWSAALEDLAETKRKLRDLSEGATAPWHWAGDGTDDLDTLGEGSMVLIRAADLRRILSGARSADGYHQRLDVIMTAAWAAGPIYRGGPWSQTFPPAPTSMLRGVWTGRFTRSWVPDPTREEMRQGVLLPR